MAQRKKAEVRKERVIVEIDLTPEQQKLLAEVMGEEAGRRLRKIGAFLDEGRFVIYPAPN